LNAFLEAYPEVRLEIDLSDGFVDLVAGQADVAVRIGPPPPASLTAHRLAANHRILCAAPAYLDRYDQPRSLAELAQRRLLAASGQLPWRLSGPDGAHLIEGESHVRTNSSELVRELVLGGAGIALRSTWDIAPELATGRLVRVLADYEGAREVAVYAVHPKGEPVPPNVRAFVRFLQTLFDPPPWTV
jgi:DNA-binding transcriptional LysR family regulator